MPFFELAKKIYDLDFHHLRHLNYPPKSDPRDIPMPDLPIDMNEAKEVADLVTMALFDAEENLVCRNIYVLKAYGIKVTVRERFMDVVAIIQGERTCLTVASRYWDFRFLTDPSFTYTECRCDDETDI